MLEIMPIRLLIIDDHLLFRKAILAPLKQEPRIDVVGTAPDGEYALQYCTDADIAPDVMLLDLNMPRIGGFEVLRRLAAAAQPSPRCVILTGDDSPASAHKAFALGAAGYMLKDNVTEESVVSAVLAAAEGGVYVDETIFAALLNFPSMSPVIQSDRLPEALTALDVEVLSDVAHGLDNKGIAAKRGTTTKTISNRLSLIYTKIGVGNRVQAALYALRLGIVQLEEVSLPDVPQPAET
jgi:DNA-binding NarL/FixJ family response regulator